MKRPNWDTYFANITRDVASRSSCLRRSVGALLVRDRRILATGYNGVPSGLEHCEISGCIREQMKVPSGQRHELCRGLHAEQNAIIQAAIHGVSISGATLYSTTYPCSVCAKMLIQAKIIEIVVLESYSDELSPKMLSEAGVKVRFLGPTVEGQNG
ncbi:MAG: cytidine/deoxycytidylate deaminase family protein [Candidatus Brocadiia bacterium]